MFPKAQEHNQRLKALNISKSSRILSEVKSTKYFQKLMNIIRTEKHKILTKAQTCYQMQNFQNTLKISKILSEVKSTRYFWKLRNIIRSQSTKYFRNLEYIIEGQRHNIFPRAQGYSNVRDVLQRLKAHNTLQNSKVITRNGMLKI